MQLKNAVTLNLEPYVLKTRLYRSVAAIFAIITSHLQAIITKLNFQYHPRDREVVGLDCVEIAVTWNDLNILCTHSYM